MTIEQSRPVQEIPLSPFPNSELLHYGGSATAIIIAIAILIRALGDMIGVLVPVMLQRNDQSQTTVSPPLSQTDKHLK